MFNQVHADNCFARLSAACAEHPAEVSDLFAAITDAIAMGKPDLARAISTETVNVLVSMEVEQPWADIVMSVFRRVFFTAEGLRMAGLLHQVKGEAKLTALTEYLIAVRTGQETDNVLSPEVRAGFH